MELTQAIQLSENDEELTMSQLKRDYIMLTDTIKNSEVEHIEMPKISFNVNPGSMIGQSKARL